MEAEQFATVKGLNPCFNGICSATLGPKEGRERKQGVSILVLMEYALRLFNNFSPRHHG